MAQTATKSAAASTKKTAAAKPDTALNAVPNKTIGNTSAPIKMEVFSDYECPSCGNFYENTLKTMIATYVAENKVTWCTTTSRCRCTATLAKRHAGPTRLRKSESLRTWTRAVQQSGRLDRKRRRCEVRAVGAQLGGLRARHCDHEAVHGLCPAPIESR